MMFSRVGAIGQRAEFQDRRLAKVATLTRFFDDFSHVSRLQNGRTDAFLTCAFVSIARWMEAVWPRRSASASGTTWSASIRLTSTRCDTRRPRTPSARPATISNLSSAGPPPLIDSLIYLLIYLSNYHGLIESLLFSRPTDRPSVRWRWGVIRRPPDGHPALSAIRRRLRRAVPVVPSIGGNANCVHISERFWHHSPIQMNVKQ